MEDSKLTKEQALEMLPEGEKVHTFRQGGFGLVGADWNRNKMLEAIEKYECHLTGPQAKGMGHGMAFKDGKGWVFVETK